MTAPADNNHRRYKLMKKLWGQPESAWREVSEIDWDTEIKALGKIYVDVHLLFNLPYFTTPYAEYRVIDINPENEKGESL